MARHRASLSTSSILASPDRSRGSHNVSGLLAEMFTDSRNSELSHRDALEQAKAEHDRVRERALRVFEMHELEVERLRIVKAQEDEQERLKRETAVLAEKQRLEALKAEKAPPPPPLPKPAPVAAPATAPVSTPTTVPSADTAKPVETVKAVSSTATTTPSTIASTLGKPTTESTTLVGEPVTTTAGKPANNPGLVAKPFGTTTSAATTVQKSLFGTPSASSPFGSAATKPAGTSPFGGAASATTTASPFGAKPAQPAAATTAATTVNSASANAIIEADPVFFPHNKRYLEIHKKLKELRKAVETASSQPGSPLKGKVGDMRREIRKSMGQLTEGAGANKIQLAKIRGVLKSSLDGTHQSPPVDVKDYVAEAPQTVSDTDVHKGDQMPSLFLYLLNIFSKSVISQFINECGANPKAADPIGVLFSQIFSDKDYHWRGRSLADIMLAKLRVTCPVLFGIRGNERIPAGREAIGWRRDGPDFIPEQAHWNRMAGLGAGFGAITLRDFSKTTRATPTPPTMYWATLAALVNTPVEQVSATQLVVLKSIIDGHTSRFLLFYGSAGLAALRVALIEFPKNVAKSPSREALAVVADRLLKDEGLKLA
ncbi:Nucleoporin GLE1 [Ceratocystis fimbriata CBS 114723]|uniref:mRNA export factor GLE1 n=1 Tax=Ceratocystis fimbriata CBS 114723 TaxID=1035309 RepID=A0A2C5X725_9PEZI|nr:Nucleoporin GLE1 [Ceratocystis fimbriata CBS 114723]